MRAVRYDRYGPPDVLHVAELPDLAPGNGEVKIRVRAAALNPLDGKARAGHLRFVPVFRGPPRGTGCDLAGEIVGVGRDAAPRHVGERVFGSISPMLRDCAFAEFALIDAANAVPIPGDLDFEQAAALPVACGTAWQALTDHAHLAAGQRVLITGAAGGVGHFAIQIAKHLGAHVVGVCSGANGEFVRGLGADEVVDYAREDFARRSDRFDVVFDAACVSTFATARQVLTETGCYINTAGSFGAVLDIVTSALVARFTSRQRAIAFVLKTGGAVWQRVGTLAAEGIVRPHIARRIALDDTADAQRAMETGHGRGKIVCIP
jgi:NADPH:quinone reductase-like Zn-dependent oxidoreductase